MCYPRGTLTCDKKKQKKTFPPQISVHIHMQNIIYYYFFTGLKCEFRVEMLKQWLKGLYCQSDGPLSVQHSSGPWSSEGEISKPLS